MSDHFKNVIVSDLQIRTIVAIGLDYNPKPWTDHYGEYVSDIVENVKKRIKEIVTKETKESLFGGLTYYFPSTILLFSKVWDGHGYSEDVVRCNLLYQTPFPRDGEYDTVL